MKHPRRASLLVALSLLTSAGTAYAECAWVLWKQATRSNDTLVPLTVEGGSRLLRP